MSFALFAMCCALAGTVHAPSGAPLAHAAVSARGTAPAGAPKRTTSDAAGTFAITEPPGTYRITVDEPGYAPATITVIVAADVVVAIALEPLDSPKLRQIASVTVDGRFAPIAGAIPSVLRTRSDLDALGYDRLVEGLQDLPGATFSRPDGGAASAISVVSLRGPDPSESLTALDGQLLNDGNTGDVDLSQLPASAFSAVDITEGLGPEDSNGSNTFGGAINFVSLRPTKIAHQALSVSAGSFGQSEGWFDGTGTTGRLGYAVALDDRNENGFVARTVPLYSSSDPTCSPCATNLGSSVASHTALVSATWSFSQRADVTARAFVLGDDRDQSSALNGIDRNAADIGTPRYGSLVGPGNQSFAQDLRAYQIRARAPLGAGELTTSLSESDDDVAIAGGAASPYDVVHQDHRYDGELSWQRAFETSQYAIGGYTRYESLAFEAPPASDTTVLTPFQSQPTLGQTIDVLYARGGFEPVAKLRLDGGVFESRYTTFGSNLDGRFGAIFTPDARTSVRFSLGTGFRAPLLIERYAFPATQLALDGNNVFNGQGSPDERPEHATEYELGATHRFSPDATLDVSLYETNLRDPVEIFYPLAAVSAGSCAANSYSNPLPACFSYSSNVGNAVYEGAEITYTQRFSPIHLTATARYGLNVAYPKNLNAQFSNPTSGGNLVDNAQFLGIPQQQGSLEFEYRDRGAHGALSGTARGKNNELNQGPFAIVNGLIGYRIGTGVDLALAGTNLFNAVSGPFTRFGAGQPYAGIGGSLPTDALFIEPAAVRFILTLSH